MGNCEMKKLICFINFPGLLGGLFRRQLWALTLNIFKSGVREMSMDKGAFMGIASFPTFSETRLVVVKGWSLIAWKEL